jgi:hypothetical protein
MENELLNSLIDAEQLYEFAPCGYFSLAPDGTIIKINSTLPKIFHTAVKGRANAL